MQLEKEKNKVFEGALVKAFGEAQVPAHHFLRVAQELKKTVEEHKQNTEVFKNHVEANVGIARKHEQEMDKRYQSHDAQIGLFKGELERYKQLAKGEQGEKGEDGLDGRDADEEGIFQRLLTQIPAPIKGDKGENGKDADDEQVTKLVIHKIQKERLIHASNIKDLPGFVKDGVKYRFEELMRGGGGGGGGGGSGSLVSETPSGLINGSNTTYTVSKTISTVISFEINGQFIGPSNYTASGNTITFTTPLPSSLSGTEFNIVYSTGATSFFTTGSNRTVTATTTATDADYLILCNATTGAITVNLPAAASSNNVQFIIKKIDSSANTVTVQANGAELIDGANTKQLGSQYLSAHVYCNGTQWYII